jgi:branched-chain amino acid aminotransferase
VSTPYIHINGRLAPSGEAAVSPYDWGFLYGDTLFETIRVHRGVPLLWREHMERLARGFAVLRYPHRPDPDDLLRALHKTLSANGLSDAAARITVSRGQATAGIDPRTTVEPTVTVTVRPYTEPPQRFTEQGMRLRTVRVPVRAGWERYTTKSGNYLDNLLAIHTALDHGDDEALLVDAKYRVLEAARSNVFIVRQNTILTPPVRLGLLPGTTRAWLMRHARAHGLNAKTGPIGYRGELRADEAFVTNAVWGPLPVAAVDGRSVGSAAPGPVTRRIMDLWNEWLNTV